MSDERYVDGPPAGAEGWREVWNQDRRYRTGGFLQRLLQKVVRKASSTDYDRQRDFNVALLDLLVDVRALTETVRNELQGDLASQQRDLKNAEAHLAGEVQKVRDLVPGAARRNDALIAALDQKIESLAVRLRDLTNPLIERAAAGAPAASDFLYRRLEDGLRGSEAEVREAMRPYVERARALQPVLDVGCGRGEFLAICRERKIEARGFDTNERSVADLRQRGFDVTLSAIPECFAGMPDGSAGSILAAHVVEHLPVEALFALFAESARVLRSGGVLMIETPNAESLLVSASEFWRDPTHLAPRHPAALVLLAREYGFDLEEVVAVHPLPEGTAIELGPDDPPAVRRVIEAVNARLFGPQDLRLIVSRR